MADCWGCRDQALVDADGLEAALTAAAEAAGASVLEVRSRRFVPAPGAAGGGVTTFAVLAESHASVHTYPEIAYAAIDVFTCGTRCDPRAAVEGLVPFLAPDRVSVQVLARGADPGAG